MKKEPKRRGSCVIVIVKVNDIYRVATPYKRDREFVMAWRRIKGRQYDPGRRCNVVPVEQRAALWALLKRFFPGKWGTGPQGEFRVPKENVNRA